MKERYVPQFQLERLKEVAIPGKGKLYGYEFKWGHMSVKAPSLA